MTLQDLIYFHTTGAAACEAFAVTPAAGDAKYKDITKHYAKRAKWHRDAEALLGGLEQRAGELAGLLLQTNELLYQIQGDPGAVPSSAIDAMRGEVFTALKPAAGVKP